MVTSDYDYDYFCYKKTKSYKLNLMTSNLHSKLYIIKSIRIPWTVQFSFISQSCNICRLNNIYNVESLFHSSITLCEKVNLTNIFMDHWQCRKFINRYVVMSLT